MTEARVKTGIAVSAMLRMADLAGRPGMVLRRGDADAGGVLLVLRGRDGVSVLSQARSGTGEAGWMRATGANPVDELAADAYVARQVGRDPDLWVVEFEAPALTPPFDVKIM
jgi:hypothetical protein